ncbi:MAG: hypothetical protein AAF618_00275 [Pseudomonadota bacterium]
MSSGTRPKRDDTARKAAILAFAETRPRFKRADIMEHCGLTYPEARRVLGLLVSERKLIALTHGKEMIYGVGDKARLLEADARSQATPEGQIWQAMRVWKRFTVADLRASCSEPPTVKKVQRYCTALASCGVLKVLRQASGAQAARYQLVRDLGALPPAFQRVVLMHDPNSQSYLDADRVLR